MEEESQELQEIVVDKQLSEVKGSLTFDFV